MPTIGVSVAVPEPWGSTLQRYRIDAGDTSARWIPTHITLLPPHEVATEELEDIVCHLGGVGDRTSPFKVHLRGTGSFRPVSPVVFVGVVDGISACERLAADVRQGPLKIERAFPYHPHVTVAHHLPEARLDQAFSDLERFEANFHVEEMWMYLHEDETGWKPTRSFPLSGDSSAQ